MLRATDIINHIDADLAACLQIDAPMARHTSLGVGGPARLLALPVSEDQLRGVLQLAREARLPTLVVGAGTNLLVRDGGFEGLVIKTSYLRAGIRVDERSPTSCRVQALAGTPLAEVCNLALRRGLAGLNFAMGIPGSLGGAVYMNAGARGSETGNLVDRLRIVTPGGSVVELEGHTLRFEYRHLIWPPTVRWRPPEDLADPCGKSPQADLPVITEITLALEYGDKARLRNEARRIWAQRRIQQPFKAFSAGCFFKNPPAGWPAARLIDAAGLKGLQYGGAQVSPVHANFIVNTGRARACEILALADTVRACVQRRFGIVLENEVVVVGEA